MVKNISSYCKIPIGFVAKHGQRMPFDVFLKLSDDKIVKLNNKDDFDGMIKRYQDKGIQEILVSKKDFESFLETFDKDLTKKFFKESEKSSLQDLVDTLEDAHKILKEGLIKLGVREATLNIAKQTAIAGLALMERTPSIFKFFRNFEKKNSTQFLNSILVAYTASCMVDTFAWQSHSIKEKISIAAMLSDIFVEEDDVELLNRWELGEISTKDLSSQILDHPHKTVKALEGTKGSIFPTEIISVVSQHHERPDGSGFPGQLQHSKMILLSCIQIVAYNFILLMNKYDFDVEKKGEILENLQNRFNCGNYKKAYNALVSMFND